MKSFSSIDKKEFKTTQRDKVINNAMNLSGLDKKTIEPLYESLSYENFEDYDKINESFNEYFKEDTLDFDKFKNDMLKITSSIGHEQKYDEDRRKIFNNKLLKTIEQHLNHKPDVSLLLEVICFILNLKNRDRRNNLFEGFVFGQRMTDLFEQDTTNNFDITDWDIVNVSAVNPLDMNIINAKEDVNFYRDMKLMLSKFSSDYGNNYHLNSIYHKIVDYIDKETEYLTNFGNSQEFDKNKYDEFLDNLINDNANALSMNVDILKTMIPDLQKLVYDLVLLVDIYIKEQSTNLRFIDRNLVSDYQRYRDILLESISSSKFSSKVYNNKLDFYNKVSAIGARDAIDIIKSVQNEFNLKIRKIINVYHTKSSEMLIRNKQINIQKQGLNM
jgi:hypothetical protein